MKFYHHVNLHLQNNLVKYFDTNRSNLTEKKNKSEIKKSDQDINEIFDIFWDTFDETDDLSFY